MTFQFIRFGWPNTAAILALAVMPAVTLATAPDRQETARVQTVEADAFCPAPSVNLIAAAATATILE
jgi:hypothetical protein